MKKVLVTGGSGFLGRQVVRLFEQQDIDVASYDNIEAHCGGDAKFAAIKGDVTDFRQLENVVKGVEFDTIVHLAAYGRNLSCQDFPQRAWDVNVNGTRNVLEIARLHPGIVKRVVCCSSNITLSDVATVYKATKLICEQLVELYADMGVSCYGLRPSNICGIGQSRTEYQPCAFAGMDIGFEKDGYFSVTGDGEQARDFVNVLDVARAFVLAAGRPDLTGRTVDICTGRLTSINEVARLAGAPVKYVEARKGDAKVLISDPKPAKRDLDFKAEIGIEQTVRDSFPSVMSRQ